MKMEVISRMKFDHKLYIVEDIKIEPPFPITSDHVLFGVDPGTTKFGLAYLWRSVCHIYEIMVIRKDDPVERILLTQDILSECFHTFDYAPLMTIEGSSFNGYRQTELAEVRASTVLWAVAHGIKPRIVPPTSIRKMVFGTAKTKAEDLWNDLPPDAASALACAYYEVKVATSS